MKINTHISTENIDTLDTLISQESCKSEAKEKAAATKTYDCATTQMVNAVFGAIQDNEIALATAVEGNIVDGGKGDDALYIVGQKNTVKGGCGDDLIYVEGKYNEVFGNDGNDEIYNYGNNSRVNGGSGNNYIESEGHHNILSAEDGNNEFINKGNYNSIIAFNGDNSILSEGTANSVRVGDGNNGMTLIGNGSRVVAGDGNNEMGVVGNNLNMHFGDGNNVIGVWSNNAKISGGDGNNIIETLDKAYEQGRFQDLADFWMPSLSKTVSTTEKVVASNTTSEVSDTQEFWSTMEGVLSADELAIAKSVDMSQQVQGVPRYIVAQAADGLYHVYQKCANTARYKAMANLADGNNYATVSELQTVNGSQIHTLTEQYEITKVTTYDIKGINNFNVNLGDGNNNLDITSGDGNLVGNLGHGNNNIKIDVGYKKSDDPEVTYETRTSQSTQEIGLGTLAGVTTNSPLIIDFNRDGKVSAMANMGVDIDNDGQADGAAVGGDKMLAMQDINGNGKIDGAEVFGNKTVDPFTGKELNAANGFEALKLVAQSAEKATGIKAYINGEVNLIELNKALASIGQNLGFISDNNTSTLEALSKVSKINVDTYKEQQETGAVQHNQLGSATFEDGSTVAVHDVWFQHNAQTAYSRFAIDKKRRRA